MKRYVAECTGTFFLALAVSQGNAIAIGTMFMALIYLTAPISGANLNPAVSFAYLLLGRHTFLSFIGYVIAQLVGAGLVSFFYSLLIGVQLPPLVLPAEAQWYLGSMELLLTMILVSVILIMSMSRFYENMQAGGIIIGLTLLGLATMLGGSYNPAIALGRMLPQMVKGAMPGVRELVVYGVMPLVGSVLAVLRFRFYNLGRV